MIAYDNLKGAFKEYELLNNRQFNLIEGLLRTSTYEEPMKAKIESERQGYSIDEAALCITALKNAQLDPVYETGTPSQTDLKNENIKGNF